MLHSICPPKRQQLRCSLRRWISGTTTATAVFLLMHTTNDWWQGGEAFQLRPTTMVQPQPFRLYELQYNYDDDEDDNEDVLHSPFGSTHDNCIPNVGPTFVPTKSKLRRLRRSSACSISTTTTTALRMTRSPSENPISSGDWRIPVATSKLLQSSSSSSSLIEQTLQQMQEESLRPEFQPLSKEERLAQRRSVNNIQQIPNFAQYVVQQQQPTVHPIQEEESATAAAAAVTTTTTTTTTAATIGGTQREDVATSLLSVPTILRRHPHPSVLQINIGLYCNQACHHCHGR
jgi:hypothetical protein